MINKKIIVLIAAAVLVCSLGLGATYAWFTSRAEADLAGGLYGAKGGLAFGSLNVDLKVDSHLQAINAAGTPIGTPIPVGSG
ncbi:MAG: SipW-dependent-type signal peptide-containing protein, partial [Clostridiales bacterium]|nr:SipW-dependent-type signal peptide-containing protein [Clostridiales bacterium]